MKPSECYEDADGSDYRGEVSKTGDGLECLSWKDLPASVFSHTWYMDFAPGFPKNHCRNPDFFPAGPYCYNEFGSVWPRGPRNPRGSR